MEKKVKFSDLPLAPNATGAKAAGLKNGQNVLIDLETIDTRATDADTLSRANAGNIGALDGRTTTNEGNIVALGGRIATAEGDIGALDARVGTAENLVNNLDMKVDGYEGRISANESDINLLDGRVTVNEGDIGSLDSRTTNLETNSATKTELNNGLATKEPTVSTGVAGQFYAHDKTWKTPPQPDLSGYATKTELNSGLATKEPKITAGVAGQFYAHDKTWKTPPQPDLSGYATTTALSSGLATKEPKITAGVAGQFYAHDKTWKTPPQPDLSGYATTTALSSGLATKEPTVNAGTVSQFWNGLKQWVAVKLSDIAPTTANRILQTNESGKVVAGSIDPINIARTNVENSFTAKQTFDASANFSSLGADEILALDASKNVMGSGVTRAQLGSLNAGNWQSSTISKQSNNEYCKILTITMSNTSSHTGWTNYQIAINRNFYGSQSFLNGVLHISAGSQGGGTQGVVYKASFIGQKSASQVFYRVVPDANGILRICEIWTRQTQGSYRNAQCQVSVLGKHPSHTVEIHQSPAQVTDPGDLIEITGIWTNATNAYVSKDLTIGGLAGNAGYIPTLDANGKVIKGASNGTSIVAGELQLYDLANHTRVPYIDANKRVKLSNVTPTELNHLSGVTSNVQAQLDNALKLEFANFCRIGTGIGPEAANKWFKMFEYPKATTFDGKMFFDVHFWNNSDKSGLLIVDGAFNSSTNAFGANARVSYLGLNSDYDPSKLALCYNSSTGNIGLYAQYVTGADRILLIPRAIVEGVKGLTYFTHSSGIDNLNAFPQKVIGTQMDLTAGAINATDSGKVSSFAGGISVPTAQSNAPAAPSEFVAIGPDIKLSQRNHGGDTELHVRNGGVNANRYLKFANNTKLFGPGETNLIYHSGYQHGGGRYTITSGSNASGSTMVQLDGGHNPSPSTFGSILLGNGGGSYLFRIQPSVGMSGPSVNFHSSNDGGLNWHWLGSIG